MTYKLETAAQLHGDLPYLTHKLKTETDDLYLFAERIPSYGIFSFGSVSPGEKKEWF